MKSDSPASQANTTASPQESPQWQRVDMDRSQTEATTVGERIVADGWSKTRIHGTQDTTTIIYRHADARRETMRRRLRETLEK